MSGGNLALRLRGAWAAFAVALVLGLVACGGGGGGDGSAGGGGGGGTGPALSADYLPLASGDQRAYRRPGGSSFEPLVFERVGASVTIDGRNVFEVVDGDGGVEYLGLNGTALLSVPGSASDALTRALGTVEILRLGLRAGDEYTALNRSITADVDGDGASETVQTLVRVRFVGFERVTAGGIEWADAARVRTQIELTVAGGGTVTLEVED